MEGKRKVQNEIDVVVDLLCFGIIFVKFCCCIRGVMPMYLLHLHIRPSAERIHRCTGSSVTAYCSFCDKRLHVNVISCGFWKNLGTERVRI